MEINIGDKLRNNFTRLKAIWPECEIGEVTASDLYYSDGMSQGAIFKILFYQGRLYITTVYIKNNGTFYSTMGNIAIKNIIIKWIESIK